MNYRPLVCVCLYLFRPLGVVLVNAECDIPATSSPTTPSQSNTSSPRSQSPMGTPSLMPMQVTLPPWGLVGVPSPGLTPPSPFSLYPAEAMNPNGGRTSSGSNSSLVPKQRSCVVAAEGTSTETGTENPYLRWGRC